MNITNIIDLIYAGLYKVNDPQKGQVIGNQKKCGYFIAKGKKEIKTFDHIVSYALLTSILISCFRIKSIHFKFLVLNLVVACMIHSQVGLEKQLVILRAEVLFSMGVNSYILLNI